VNQFGRGSQCCTITGGTRHVDNLKLGPDGTNWELLSEVDVVALTQNVNSYRHIAKKEIDHLCAGYGGWAFEVFTSSLPHAVTFLHIRPPRKLDQAMGGGEGSVVLTFTGAELLGAYQAAKAASRAPRVWRRNVTGWDEIAINFCLKH
jgi:hypothetical protein